MKFLVVFCFIASSLASQPLDKNINANPGIELALTQAGINYAKSIAVKVLNKEVPNFKIPDIHSFIKQKENKKAISYSISNIKITEFGLTDDDITIEPVNGQLQMKLNNIKVGLALDYDVKLLFIPAKGKATASVSGVSFAFTGSIDVANGKPHLMNPQVSTNIDKLSLHFQGDFISKILQLLNGPISSAVRGQIKGQVNSQIGTIITKLNSLIDGVEFNHEVYDKFGVDFLLTSKPTFATGLMIIPILGRIYYGDDKPVPVPAPKAITNKWGGEQGYVAVTDYLVNTLGYAAQQSNLLQYTLTGKLLDSILPGADKYLDTTCVSKTRHRRAISDPLFGFDCIGAFLPQLQKTMPNGQVEMTLISGQAPQFSIEGGDITIDIVGDLDMKVRFQDKTVKDALTCALQAQVKINALAYNAGKITAKIIQSDPTMTMKTSQIGDISNDVISDLWKLLVQEGLGNIANELLSKGIDVPIEMIPYVDVKSISLGIQDNAVVVGASVDYTGPTL